MVTIRKRWRLRTLMGLIALTALGMAFLRKLPDLGPVFRLKYADPQGRMSAAVELGKRGSKKGNFAEPALVAALSDPDQGVCDCAAWALDQFGSTSPALVKALAKQVEVETAQSLRWRMAGRLLSVRRSVQGPGTDQAHGLDTGAAARATRCRTPTR